MADLGKPLVAYDSMSMAEADPSFWDGMSATYGYQYRPIMGALYGSTFEEDENFDIFQHLSLGDLENRNRASFLTQARSKDHLNYLRNHADKMQNNRDVMSRTGWGSIITAGILDPVNLLSLPFKGVTMTARAISGAKSGFVIGAGVEAIRAPFDPDSSLMETGVNIAGSTALVGVLGGLTGVRGSFRHAKRFGDDQQAVAKAIDETRTTPFNYKDNRFVNSPLFQAVTTPFKRVMQSSAPQSVKKLMLQIGGDGGLTQAFNMAGQGISSVFQRSVTYFGDYIAHSNKMTNIYHDFLKGAGERIPWGSKDFKEFADRLGRERILREADASRPRLSVHEERFIDEMDLFYTRYGVQMIDNGMLLTKKSLIEKIKTLENKVKDLSNKFKAKKDGREKIQLRKMLDRTEKNLQDAKVLEKLDFDPKYKGTYFPRYFKIDTIATRIDEFKDILKKWYTDNPFLTKEMIKGEKLKVTIENNQIKILEKQQLIKDIELKKHGSKFRKDNPDKFKNTGGVDSKSFYTDKQLNALKKLKNEIPILESKINADEIKLTQIEINMPIRIEEAVDETVNKILNKTTMEDDFMGHGLSKHLRHRELDIPNHLILDFIETNPLDVAMYYIMRTGSKIEFANTFKGKSINDLIDEEQLAMVQSGMDDTAIAKTTSEILHMYDRVVGTAVHRPDALNRRISRALTDWTAYVFLGRAGLSSLPELGMIIMQHASKQGPLGWQNIGGTLSGLKDLKALGLSAKEVQLAGEALDMVLGMAHNRMYEDYLRNPFVKGVSKLNEQGKRAFYTMNGLAPITQITKMMTGVLGQHTLVDRCIKLVNGTLDQEGIELLSRYGLVMRDAKKIKRLFDDGVIETSESGNLIVANTEAWGDVNQALVRKFRGALNTMTRNTIINATPADKPTIIDGVVYAKMNPALRALGFKVDKRSSFGDTEMVRIENGLMALPFQFWNYTLGATTKILASSFDAERTGKVAGFTTMMALGYLTLYLKNPGSFNRMDYEDQLARSIDQTGITGIYSDLFYMGLHARHRMGDMDRDDTFIQPKYRVEASPLGAGLESTADFAGATPSYLFDIADTINHFAEGETDEGIRQALRSAPLSSLYGMRTLMGETLDLTGVGRY